MRFLPAIAAILVLFLAIDPAQARPRAGSYLIIVNSKNPESQIDRQFLEGAFLKKVTRWPNDEVIRPAELVESDPARQQFSADILERSVEAIKGYWQQRIFSGRDVPPPEFKSSQEVVNYVVRYEGAIGCIDGAVIPEGVKILTIK